MRFDATIVRIQRERPALGWLLSVVGVLLPFIACAGVLILFKAKEFSSNVRDDFEQVPGLAHYALFWLGIAFFVFVFFVGLLLIRARLRGRGAA